MIIECECLPHRRQLPLAVTTSKSMLATQFVTSSAPVRPGEVSVLCAKHLEMDFHPSSPLCRGCSVIREVVSNAPGKGSLWYIQKTAPCEVKAFKDSQPKSHNLFSDFFLEGDWCYAHGT